jgi:uncharacterized protein
MNLSSTPLAISGSVLLLAALLIGGTAIAGPDSAARQTLNVPERHVMSSIAFAQTFPDHRWRARGSEAFGRGRHEEARRHFMQSARYGDKLSQAMLAEMHWNGLGGSVNRATAYAWMDLAAERGYPHLLALREHYWEQLDDHQRQQALQVGEGIYREYGDEAAKPRMEAALRRSRNSGTGSRTGASVGTRVYEGDGSSSVNSFTPGTEVTGFRDSRFWDVDRYWAILDRAYGNPPDARVVVREIRHSVPLHRQTGD